MGSFRMSEVLDDWDRLVTFTSYERTPQRVQKMRNDYEIQGSIDDWLENKASNVIDEYAQLMSISFETAAERLHQRPVKPWPVGL